MNELHVATISYQIGMAHLSHWGEPRYRALAFQFSGRPFVYVEWRGCMATERRETMRGKVFKFGNQRELFGPRASSIMGFIVMPDTYRLQFIPADRFRLVCRSALARIAPMQFADVEFWF